MDSVLKDFCEGYDNNSMTQCTAASADLPDNWLNFTTRYNVLYYIGCILGAYLGGVVADKFGRRTTIFTAGFLFCVGTCLLVFTNKGNHVLSLVARVIQGFGSAGLINYGVKDTTHGWRTTNAVAMAFPVIVMFGIYCVPESPRWVYQHKGREAAESTLARLRKTDNVGEELKAIGDELAEEGNGEATWKEVFHPTIRRRVFIAMALQLLQQATGINPIFTYGAQIFKDVLGDGIGVLLILQIINFLSTIPAMHWVDKTGRRSLLLLGGAGMVIGHLVSGISFSADCHAFFVFNFAISWGPVCWIYPAEIFPLKVRAKAVSLSTMTNWAMGALMIGIPKLFPYLHVNGVFFLFAVLCACAGIFVYYFCPETKNVLLENIEMLFNKNGRGAEDVKTPNDVA
ncbi:hypothetical protein Ae201684P_000492 [Aphanomyces euteiches]|uniref:Hexose transporter 1 n=1 Tax=Aphanomyces euteiches TaxID=100861 RepID=A0A6G0XRJ0_9STRA|nr:hypothetical protein Ae201684_002036 [Aphanomyces euteiches]KAH9087080.1 hypothetical protein Ae201684P_000492 [Aphanomyces euteiches]KAH9152242.1 hypothetical protein AeRB84_005294 [Aphanomyces euteiches]